MLIVHQKPALILGQRVEESLEQNSMVVVLVTCSHVTNLGNTCSLKVWWQQGGSEGKATDCASMATQVQSPEPTQLWK